MKRLLGEPLLHFVLLGAAIFVAYRLTATDPAGGSQDIVVTQGRIASLAEGFARTWQRPPTQDELDGLVRDYLREEVAYREALALGLDRDDTIIRRRLRQKLEFVADDLAAQAEPTDDELLAYLNAHPDAFRIEGRLTFSHVYLDPDRHGDRLADEAAKLLTALDRAGPAADIAGLGDATMLERTFEDVTPGDIATQLGDAFAAKLGGLPVGRWQGPIESAYGAHLVIVRDRTEGRLPALDEARDAVRREWANARRLEITEAYYRKLLEGYKVTTESPPDDAPANPEQAAGQ